VLSADSPQRWVYGFAAGGSAMGRLLGNKGANLAEMVRVLGAEMVPGGFIVTTAACVEYMRTGAPPDDLDDQIDAELAELERASGKTFGDANDPLLLSVRSGAPVSMPGMLDTILNLGLSERSLAGLAEISGERRFALDSRRRLVQMFGEVVRGVPGAVFEQALTAARQRAGVAADSELGAKALEELIEEFLTLLADSSGNPFPEDPREQLREALLAVFDSWQNERAVTYRRLNGIPDELGTAVVVQRMVFGNLGSGSGSGVAFSRNPTTGEPLPDGDYLDGAQGEDVVAGVRNTEDLDGLRRRMPEIHAQLLVSLAKLERHFKDIQDIEFTVERGRLFILQTRNAKRHARAAVRFAVDSVDEGLLDRGSALMTIDPTALEALMHPSFAPGSEYEEIAHGVGASPGAARGAIAFTAEQAIAKAAEGVDTILVRTFTSADDVGGFNAARGIVTSHGGKSSHAAIVARAMGRPCVCGAAELEIDVEAGVVQVDGLELEVGTEITIDGTSGAITADQVPLLTPELDPAFAAVLEWSDSIRRLEVRANADTADDAAQARKLGAEGIGLCRTEHMFFGDGREALVREMFIAGELWRRQRTLESRRRFGDALEQLERLQKDDFVELFREMPGLPVTIRLLDPPMHEFLDLEALERALADARAEGEAAVALASEGLEVATSALETNPMLGSRGVRLGLLLPELYGMQVRAIVHAAAEAGSGGERPEVEIMVPLVAFASELEEMRARIEEIVAAEGAGEPATAYAIGTMIELPRACLTAGAISAHADFLSFGTNDLTQTALGFSRDDAERELIPLYLERGLLRRSPFESLDVDGVGELVRLAAERGRATKPNLHLGVCGEHGGDPASIGFFHGIGLDYVSCSAFRIPIARVAAAQAVISERAEP
jgi:pyruvate, orthophosphate dikinase